MSPRWSRESGTTLLELIVAAALMAAVTAVVLQLLLGARTTFVMQPEIADMQQRLRVAVDVLSRDLRAAGVGLIQGESPVPLWAVMPAVRPGRRGLRGSDAELAAFDDRLSIIYAPLAAVQAPLGRDMASPGDTVWIDGVRVGCVPGTACGIRRGARLLLFDIGGVGSGYDLFTVTGTRGDALMHGSPNPALSRPYRVVDSWLTEVVHHVYYHDAVTSRLMRYDGYRGDQPLVDHVVDFEVAYYADPAPSSVPPPPPGLASCLYEAGTPPRPLLRDLGGETPQRLTLSELRDGPVCGVAPNRFDGDLLRVRRIGLTIRVSAASERLRRTASSDAMPGSDLTPGAATIEDYSVSFDVAPRVLGGSPRPPEGREIDAS